jgi:hypothetical protein
MLYLLGRPGNVPRLGSRKVIEQFKIITDEPRPAGTVLNLEYRGRVGQQWIPNSEIERIEFFLDGSVLVAVKGNPMLGIFPRKIKFVGPMAQEIRRQVQKQSDQFTDVMGKQSFIGKQKKIGRRHLACLLKRKRGE